MNKITSIDEYPSQEELDAGGYVLAVAQLDMKASDTGYSIDPSLLTDVTEVELPEIIGARDFANFQESHGGRVYLIRDSQVVLDMGMNGVIVFGSVNSAGEECGFMGVKVRRSQKTQTAAVRMLDEGVIPDNKFANPE